MNVALGGTLYQDLKSRQQCEHFDFWHRSVAAHPVELDPDSFLAKQLKTDVLTVNSIHRQAIDNLGKRLWICADSPDSFRRRWKWRIILSALQSNGILSL